MRKILSLLTLLLVLRGQAQIVSKYPATTGQQFGLIVYKSTKAPAKAPLVVFLHGIGGRGKGTAADLERLAADVSNEFKAGVEKYGLIGVAVQSDNAFTIGEPAFARSWALKNLPIDSSRKYLTGYSWGGGGVAGFIKSSPTNARAFDAAAPIAMTGQSGAGYRNIADAKLPVWIFHNMYDNNGGTPPLASQRYYDSLVAWTPAIPPSLTLFDKLNHGGWGEAYSSDRIPIPAGSQGTTAPAVNLWEWFLLNSSSTRVPVPVMAPPCSGQSAVIGHTLAGNTLTLDARGSCGYKSAEWRVTDRPASVSPWASLITSGARWETATASLPTNGSYTIQLITYSAANYSGTTKTTTVTVTVGIAPEPVKKTVLNYDLVRKVVTFADGSQEAINSATQDVTSKILTIVTDKGTYTF